MRLRTRDADQFQLDGIAERVAPYDYSRPERISAPDAADDEAVERAATLLLVMPANQRRETIEKLVSPNDPHRGRVAVDALIDAAFAVEDEKGHLRRAG